MENKEKLKTLLDELLWSIRDDAFGCIAYLDRDPMMILIMDQVPDLIEEAWEEICRPPRKTLEDLASKYEVGVDSEVHHSEEIFPYFLSLVDIILYIPLLREKAWSLLYARCMEKPKDHDIIYSCLKERLVECMKVIPEFRGKLWDLLVVIFTRILAGKNINANRSSITDCCIDVIIHCPEFAQSSWEIILSYADGEDFIKVMRRVTSLRKQAWDKLVALDDPKNKDFYLKEVADAFLEFRRQANGLRAQLNPIIQKMVILSKESI